MRVFSIALVLVMAGVTLFSALALFMKGYRKRRHLRPLLVVTALLFVVGWAGWFSVFLSAFGAFNWLPRSFEWPVGYPSGVITLRDGVHVVPHPPSSRVQIYDRDWRFVRGWHVDAAGGRFKLLPAAEDHFDVITARTSLQCTYRLSGEMIERRDYSPATYESFPDLGQRILVPTLPWFWTLSSPFLSWALVALGGIGLAYLGRALPKGTHSRDAAVEMRDKGH